MKLVTMVKPTQVTLCLILLKLLPLMRDGTRKKISIF
jgi:hypothetical protein